MRICVLTHNLKDDNGGGVFSRRLLRGLQERLGAQIIAFTTVASGEPFERPILWPGVFAFLSALPRLRRAMRACDVIHAFDAYPYGIIASLVSLGLRKKIILTAVGTGSIRYLYHSHWLLTSLTRWALRRATTVVAISNFTKGLMTSRLPDLKVQVIHPGVDADRFAPQDDAIEAGEAGRTVVDSEGTDHTISNLRPYVLSVGSVRWRKGYKRSLKAFALARKQFPQLRYVIVGKTRWEKYFREVLAIITTLGLEDTVFFLNGVEDTPTLRTLYRNAELFCLLSQNWGYDVEGFGMVFLEAAAAGLPVVGAMGSGVDEAVREQVNGLLVNWQDEQALAQAIIKIMGDQKLRAQMSDASLAWAGASAWETRVGEYVTLYQKLSH